MKYELEWVPEAESALTAIWLPANSELRSAITKAAHAIDRSLERDPLNQGESRPSGHRIMFEFPLAVIFEVVEDPRLVRILHVWRIRRKGNS